MTFDASSTTSPAQQVDEWGEGLSKWWEYRRSFFRYFGTKEDVVLGDLAGRGEVIAVKLAERPAHEDPWAAIRAAFHESQETITLDRDSERAFGQMLFDTPWLRARLVEKRMRWQELFVP